MAEYRTIKKFEPFIMGVCNCTDPNCKVEFSCRNSSGYLKRFVLGHNSRGSNNPRYKGFKLSTEKYPQMFMPWHPNADIHGYVLTHVWMMSRHLKRPIVKGEIVHHIDGDISNYKIENLRLMPNQSEHRKLHRKLFQGTRRCSNPICKDPEKTQVTNGEYYSWYNDGNGGWLCRRCYCMKNYKYEKKKK
jgi:hypothetical protein